MSYFEKQGIRDKFILLESQHGRTAHGNIFHTLKELAMSDEYADYKLFLSAKAGEVRTIKTLLKENEICGVEVVVLGTGRYFEVLATAKYLINDNSFLPFFVKREGQIYLNLWHGTPLKTLGRSLKKGMRIIGSAQKNFYAADYILFPNDHTREKIVADYMLENMSAATAIISGYPRNVAFFNMGRREEIRTKENIQDKEVFAYMPTWRPNREVAHIYLLSHLLEIDKGLKENQIVYVNLHPNAKRHINYKLFKRIRPFPARYESYELLNAVDCLISDYSSVIFDFAITRKKVILFSYDEESYLEHRDLYIDLSELPFSRAESVQDLLGEMNSPKEYEDVEFLKEFCNYDHDCATKNLLEEVILGKSTNLRMEKIANNGKENVLLYVGNLSRNGVTASVKNLLSAIDLNKRNYFITFDANTMGIRHEGELLTIPKNVGYIGITTDRNMSLLQEFLHFLYMKNVLSGKLYLRMSGNPYRHEVKRLYGDAKFSHTIQFGGYETYKILLFAQFDANRVIYVHSDMINEIKERGNQHLATLKYAYGTYDRVAVVTEAMIPPTREICKKAKIYLTHNLIDGETISRKANECIELDHDTKINKNINVVKDFLRDPNVKTYIAIGRFSPEKGHKRLMDAFERVYQYYSNVRLIIIGGHGVEYFNTLNYVKQLKSKDNIVIVRSVSNPYAILNMCDCLVMPSLYEGFGLTIAEASVLGKSVIAVDIPGPRDFVKKHGGRLIDNSENGIFEGMIDFLNGEMNILNVDYTAYNKEAVQQFENLLNVENANK